MEARLPRVALFGAVAKVAACAVVFWGSDVFPGCSQAALAASHRTRNFVVTADGALAREVGEEAERFRRELAIEWLGHELPAWREPCPIQVTAGPHLGAGGATSFMFDRGRPFGWTMSIQGSRERVLDSVLPHEVTHTIFATHYGRPLPRWADEGACTVVEHEVERKKQERLLYTFLTTNQGIAFNRMFAMTEYPRNVLPLYAQGYSLTRFLIQHGGKQKFVKYVGDGMKTNDWHGVTRQYYGYRDLSELQLTWVDWVRKGCPPPDAGAAPRALAAPEGADSPALASQLALAAPAVRPAHFTSEEPRDALAESPALTPVKLETPLAAAPLAVFEERPYEAAPTTTNTPPGDVSAEAGHGADVAGESYYARQRDLAYAQRARLGDEARPPAADDRALDADAAPDGRLSPPPKRYFEWSRGDAATRR